MPDRPFLTRRSVIAGAAALTAGSLAHANWPSSQSTPQRSVVGVGTVTDCKFNQDHECYAGGASELSGTSESPANAGGSVTPAFCHNCGSKLPSGANFCPSCGTKVDKATAVL